MGLTVTVLGACGSYPGPEQACSGYLVRGEGTTIWLDAGSGTMANLQRHVSLHEVDAVVISHEHPDHMGDLNGFFVACRYYIDRAHLPVYGPAGARDAMYFDGPPLEWHVVSDEDRRRVGGLDLTFSATDHSAETLAVRVDGGGRSVGYSADSSPAWSLTALGPGLDLALCEATYLQDHEGEAQHMSARQAGISGREAGVGRLVLTHVSPGVDREAIRHEGAAAFGADVTVAADHDEYVA